MEKGGKVDIDKLFCGIIKSALEKEEGMKRSHLTALLVVALFVFGLTVPALAQEKGAGDFLIDGLLGAGEGAMVGKASGGKAGKGALIGVGTALGREAIIKPILKGGLLGGRGARAPQSRQVVTQSVDPYSQGYQDGFKEGFQEGYNSGLSATRR